VTFSWKTIELIKGLIWVHLMSGQMHAKVEDGGSKMEDSRETTALSSILNPPSSLFRWHLTDVERVKKLRKPTGHPQPVWFTTF
jgi:hypothetical protein